MRLANRRLILVIIFVAAACAGCYEANTNQKASAKKRKFIYRETIAKGNDTGMTKLGSFKRINIADVLCQHWHLENDEDIPASVIPDEGMRESMPDDLVLFKDSTVLLNPFGNLKLGMWQVKADNKSRFLLLGLEDGTTKQYGIEGLTSNHMDLILPENRSLSLRFSAPAQVHQNMYNDPFHPANNRWRVKPVHPENDSAIRARIKNCLLFYALYYRDHIKRKGETISFEGLPYIFEWYNGGIGLPDKDELSDSWIECFYNKEQALKGYAILRKLIVEYEFNWPRGTPGWTYRTHSVLEQMYHKVDDLKVE
jgi:hypothetical protein